MLQLNRILLPTDFSKASHDAARYAMALAARFGSELHIIHVLDLRTTGMAGLLSEESGPRPALESILHSFLASEMKPFQVRRSLLSGDPGHEIVRYAEQNGTDMIVLSTHGYGLFRQLLLGSVSAKVLHDADCPVWTGVHMEPGDDRAAPAFERIGCAIDLSPDSETLLKWADEFARKVNGSLTLIHVFPDVNEEWRASMVAQGESHAAKLLGRLNMEAPITFEFGAVGPALARAVRRLNAGVLVIGRGAAHGALGRLRSSSYATIRESPCPVISV
jgi:nucleotide-binding universal stress UspA family protein